MKILDKYIIKNFLTGYLIAFFVLIGLRIIIELFVNLDEFSENEKLGTLQVVANITYFYGIRIPLYFRDFAGMITVVATAFTFGKMVRSGELIAVMASGVSLKRLVVPVFVIALLMTGLFVIDQEFIIPPLADKLVRSEDDVRGEKSYGVRFINDEHGSLLFAQTFDSKNSALNYPTILLRKQTNRIGVWEVTGWISADKAVYNHQNLRWDLINGIRSDKTSLSAPIPFYSYTSDVGPKELPVRRKAENKSLLSWAQLNRLSNQKNKIKDQGQLYAQMQSHITDPIISLVMLMISVPILICRDPKTLKTAVMFSFTATTACFITTFVSKLFATEAFFDKMIPEFWVWLPVFIFLPVAVIELDSMKT